MKLKKIASTLMLITAVSAAHAEVCKQTPGSVSCGAGTVEKLTGNGMVSMHGTTVNGPTTINGMLTADDANFSALNVNGTVSLMQCSVNEYAEIKGSLNASSSKFEQSLEIYSGTVRFINSKISNNLQIHHTDDSKQEVYLDNNSEVGGDVIFDDGHGEVYLRGGSKIVGKVVGGRVVEN